MANPQINAITFRNTLRQAYDANPTPSTAMLIAQTLLSMADSLDAQATQIGAPYAVQLNGTRLRDRLRGLVTDIENWKLGGWNNDIPPVDYVRTYLFSGYPNPGVWEDEAGVLDTGRLRGEAWETATFYNQVGAIDNPLNTTYFGDGIKGWIAKNMTKAVVATAQIFEQSETLTDAVNKWEDFKGYVATQTEQLTKKATGWMWLALAIGGAWLWRESTRGEPN
jgi:hypothetical protein